MGIFQALHGEFQHSSELFFAFCSLLSIALDGFSGSKKAYNEIVLILLALAETSVRIDADQLSSLVEMGFPTACLSSCGEIREKVVSMCRRDNVHIESSGFLRDGIASWKDAVEFLCRNHAMPLVPLTGD